MLTDVLLPLVMGGEPKLPTLKSMASSLEALACEDRELDLSDDVVSFLFDLLSLLRATTAMASLEWKALLEHQDDAQAVKQRSRENNCMGAFWTAIHQSQFKERSVSAYSLLASLSLYSR